MIEQFDFFFSAFLSVVFPHFLFDSFAALDLRDLDSVHDFGVIRKLHPGLSDSSDADGVSIRHASASLRNMSNL